MIKSILTDIEGTTSSIAFVKDTLYPHSLQHLRGFVERNRYNSEIRDILMQVKRDACAEIDRKADKEDWEPVVKVLLTWINEDRKYPPLKELQGFIWEEGYMKKELTGHIYADAYKNLKEWDKEGISLYVFSSGSVKSQKLLFGHTKFGDIRYLFSGFFDTQVGAKKDPKSYCNIMNAINRQPNQISSGLLAPKEILFLSDSESELNAAKEAGLHTTQLIRDCSDFVKHLEGRSLYPQATDFDGVDLRQYAQI